MNLLIPVMNLLVLIETFQWIFIMHPVVCISSESTVEMILDVIF